MQYEYIMFNVADTEYTVQGVAMVMALSSSRPHRQQVVVGSK